MKILESLKKRRNKMTNYGSAIGNVVGAAMVVGAVSKLAPKKKKCLKKRKGGRKKK